MNRYNIDKIEHTTYGERLDKWIMKFKDRCALSDKENSITFEVLGKEIDSFAAYLLENRIKKDDVIMIQLTNSIAFFVSCFAMFKIGVIPLLVYPACREKELETFADLTEPKGFFSFRQYKGADHTKIADMLCESHKSITLCLYEDEITKIIDKEYVLSASTYEKPNPLDTALLILSGGSTGVPKLIERTHADHIFTSEAVAEKCGFDENTVYMAAMPVEHNFNAVGCIGALSRGGSVTMSNSGAAGDMLDIIRDKHVTATALVPSMAASLATTVEQRGNIDDISSLSLIQLGGAMCTQEVIRKVNDILKCTAQQIYGMGEGIVFSTSYNDNLELILECQGSNICPFDDIRIVDENLNDVPHGECGELIGKGPCIITEYFKGRDINNEKFTPNGYLRTGDKARFVFDDHIQIVGRIKDTINRGGEKIDPSEIEKYLQECDGIQDVAVVGVPDKLLGQKICAAVIGKNDITLQNIKNELSSKGIAGYKLPDMLLKLDKWPLTSVKKIDKKELVKMATEQSSEKIDNNDVLESIQMLSDEDEKNVMTAWAESLGFSVNKEDNFIELGGNSLSASEMLEKLFAITGIRISMEEFYQNTSFSDFIELYKKVKEDE